MRLAVRCRPDRFVLIIPSDLRGRLGGAGGERKDGGGDGTDDGGRLHAAINVGGADRFLRSLGALPADQEWRIDSASLEAVD
jgi:hypothetical protein